MPTLLNEQGYRFYFYAGDRGEPPHVHVEANGHRAKVWLRDLHFARTGGFNAAELRRITAIAREHRDEFIRGWHEFHRLG